MDGQYFPSVPGIRAWLFVLGVLTILGLSSCLGEPTPDPDHTNLPLVIQSSRTHDESKLPLIIDDTQDSEGFKLPLIINQSSPPQEVSPSLAPEDGDPSREVHLPLITQQKALSEMTPVPFQTIEQKAFAGTGQIYEPTQSIIMVFTSFEEVLSINGSVTETAMDQLAVLDYGTHFALVVFDGVKPTLGYAIEVTQLMRDDSRVYVDALRTEPGSETSLPDLVSSPYHLITVEKVDVWDRMVEFILVINNDLIAGEEQFIP